MQSGLSDWRGANWPCHVLQNGPHPLLPRSDISESQRRRLQIELLLRGDRWRLLDFRPEAQRRGPSLRLRIAGGDWRGRSRRVLARHQATAAKS